MKFEKVQTIFYRHVHRRYHRLCRPFFLQLLCLSLELKVAYLFDLFPLTVEQIRSLLTEIASDLDFPSLIVKYSINDIVIVHRCQLLKLVESSPSSVLVVDLTTMKIKSNDESIEKIRDHLRWLVEQPADRIDFDNERDEDWASRIQSLNHSTVFGYLLGYPIVYSFSLDSKIDVDRLKHFRVTVKIDETFELYSFSCPIHQNLDEKQIDQFVDQWFKNLSSQRLMSIEHSLEKQIRQQSAWCL